MAKNHSRTYNGVAVPDGDILVYSDGRPALVDHPIIPFIEGDGIGPDIWAATRSIIDAAVETAYGGSRRIAWYEVFAGGKAQKRLGRLLPTGTLWAIRRFGVAIKGPLATPTGGGWRSLNVRLRQKLDLYQCVRPVRYFDGVPSVVKNPQDLDVVIFRENTEDVYAGIEYRAGSTGAKRLAAALGDMGVDIPDGTGIGIKIMSKQACRRLIRAAIEFAIASDRKVVTLVHKGNIQKFTEGAFRDWGVELALEEFGDRIILEDQLWSEHGGVLPDGKILLNDRIADAMFQELLTRPKSLSVIATSNLNGDYLSDACAAQVGGLGIAPGANIGDGIALFEATHGIANDLAGKNKANPSSLLLSAVMMLQHIGWSEAADLVVRALSATIAAKALTVDLASGVAGSRQLSTSQFGEAVISNLEK